MSGHFHSWVALLISKSVERLTFEIKGGAFVQALSFFCRREQQVPEQSLLQFVADVAQALVVCFLYLEEWLALLTILC